MRIGPYAAIRVGKPCDISHGAGCVNRRHHRVVLGSGIPPSESVPVASLSQRLCCINRVMG